MRSTALSTFLFVAILSLGCLGVALPGKADEHCEDPNNPQYDPAECDGHSSQNEPKDKAKKEELVLAPVTADIRLLDGIWTARFDNCVLNRNSVAWTVNIELGVKNGDFELVIGSNVQGPIKILGKLGFNGRIDNKFDLNGSTGVKRVLIRVDLRPNDGQSLISVGESHGEMLFNSNCRTVMNGTFVTNSKGTAERQKIAAEKARKLAEVEKRDALGARAARAIRRCQASEIDVKVDLQVRVLEQEGHRDLRVDVRLQFQNDPDLVGGLVAHVRELGHLTLGDQGTDFFQQAGLVHTIGH